MAIVWPTIALVGLTAVVWILMYYRRLSEIHAKKIKPQSLATVAQASEKLNDVSAAENFSNLLEAPVLFYVLCLWLYVTASVTEGQVVLAWLYVGLRVVHSVIHVTNNHVVSRWFFYVLSTVCLFTMWVIFATAILMQ